VFASADDIARTVLFAVTQPIDLDLFEIVVRPGKDLPIGETVSGSGP
jgi:NADP-dependent 3-hydroxy acid dehydrogenase YdfG